MVDLGVPDGAQMSAVWRPKRWLRVHGGGGFNLVSFGLRGGVSWLPLEGPVVPTVAVEGGHFFGGDARGVSELLGMSPDSVPEDLSYSYANGHVGLEFSFHHTTLFLRGGYSYLVAHFTPSDPGASDVRFEDEAELRAFLPSAKLGIVVYLR